MSRFRLVGMVVAVLALLASACGDDTGTASAPPTEAGTPVTTEAASDGPSEADDTLDSTTTVVTPDGIDTGAGGSDPPETGGSAGVGVSSGAGGSAEVGVSPRGERVGGGEPSVAVGERVYEDLLVPGVEGGPAMAAFLFCSRPFSSVLISAGQRA